MVPAPLRFMRVLHVNQIVDSYDRALEHYRSVFGAQLVMENPGGPVQACLIVIGGVIFELFYPKPGHETGQHRLLARYGSHYQGVEMQVPDLDEARRLLAEHGIRVIQDAGAYLLTHPADGLGVCFELFDHEWDTDPPPPSFIEKVAPPSYWRDEHPLGLSGLASLAVAVADLDEAVAFYARFCGAQELRRESRPVIGAEVAVLDPGAEPIELVAPAGPGFTADYLERFGPRIMATTFLAPDLERVEAHLARSGVKLGPGLRPESLTVAADDNYGAIYEFVPPDAHPTVSYGKPRRKHSRRHLP